MQSKAHFETCVGSVRLFGYQHVGSHNVKCLRSGSIPMQARKKYPFAFWWNIGLRIDNGDFGGRCPKLCVFSDIFAVP